MKLVWNNKKAHILAFIGTLHAKIWHQLLPNQIISSFNFSVVSFFYKMLLGISFWNKKIQKYNSKKSWTMSVRTFRQLHYSSSVESSFWVILGKYISHYNQFIWHFICSGSALKKRKHAKQVHLSTQFYKTKFPSPAHNVPLYF